MPLDSSIAMGAKLPELPNPMDMAIKAMTLKDLSSKSQLNQIQNQQAQQDFSDNQALRTAVSNNTKVDPSGVPTIDRSGMLRELGTTSPSLVPKAAMQFAQQDMEIQNQKFKSQAEKMGMAGQLAGSVTDQPSLDNLHKTATAMGLDTSPIPTQYDPVETPKIMANLQMRALTAQQQIEAQAKQQGLTIEQNKANIENKKLDLELKKNSSQQNQETLSALQALRGNPALQRAETNVLSAKNLNDLAEQLRDPNTGEINLNNANPQQVRLANHELLRMASGGSGSEADLESLQPGTPQYKLAELHQKLTGKVSGADAAQYLQQGLDYANTLSKSSSQFLYQNAKHVVDAKRNYLAPQDQQQYNSWLNNMKSGKAFFGDMTGGQAPANTGSDSNGSGSPGSKYIPSPQEAQAELARRKKGKLAEK